MAPLSPDKQCKVGTHPFILKLSLQYTELYDAYNMQTLLSPIEFAWKHYDLLRGMGAQSNIFMDT